MQRTRRVLAILTIAVTPIASGLVVLAQPLASPSPDGTPGHGPSTLNTAPRPATINHVVLITLRDPARAEALIEDSDRMLGTIPSVVSYFCGRHLESGRTTVDGTYTVALYVGFNSMEGYQAYLDHEGHTELVAAWGPEVESMRIFDVHDPTP